MKVAPAKLPSAEQRKEFDLWKESRRPKTIEDLPEGVKERLKVLNKLPLQFVYIAGSYAVGSWIDESSSESEKELRFLCTRKKGLSDLDIYTIPYLEIEGFDCLKAPSKQMLCYYER